WPCLLRTQPGLQLRLRGLLLGTEEVRGTVLARPRATAAHPGRCRGAVVAAHRRRTTDRQAVSRRVHPGRRARHDALDLLQRLAAVQPEDSGSTHQPPTLPADAERL